MKPLFHKCLFLLVSACFSGATLAVGQVTLPDLGSAGLGSLSNAQSEAIGRDIVARMHEYNMIEKDPELQQYINDLGARIVGGSNTHGEDFHFYIIRDDAVNAFALPGGHIGINRGLIRETESEAELAGVIAHEIAHVTQRHIARRIEENRSSGLKGIAALLAAIAVAAAGGNSDAVGGTLMLGSGLMAQDQINFTRSQEYEADRVGIEYLHNADFDPSGMVSFFETMQRRQRLQGVRLPEYFSTHPLGTSRVVEATQRARQMESRDTWESRLYPLIKGRLAAMADSSGGQPDPVNEGASAAERYRTALEWLEYGKPEEAIRLFAELREEDDSIIPYHLGLARAYAAADNRDKALAIINRALELFPESLPVGITYAELQRDFGQPRKGLRHLRRLFDYQSPAPDSLRLMAQLASAAGEQAESHYYLSEFFIRQGDLASARVQLQLALDLADLGSDERRQYQARLEQISEVLAEQRANQRQPRRGSGRGQHTSV